jgi:hypothetical protein
MGFRADLRIRLSPFFLRYPCRYGASRIDTRTAVDRERQFIYFRIPKAANTTVSYALSRSPSETQQFDAGIHKSGYDRVSSLGFYEALNLPRRFFLFSVVRNPFTRVASAYLDKIKRKKRQSLIVTRALGKPPEAAISFLEFCRYLHAGGYRHDVHWFRQTDLIACGVNRLHYIGSVETLDADLRALRSHIGGDLDFRQTSWDHGKTDASSQLLALYDSECLDLVTQTYKPDFRLLGYSRELTDHSLPPSRATAKAQSENDLTTR